MIFKIKTSNKTMDIFEEINSSEGLQPYILSKIAISLSLKSGERLSEDDFRRNNKGLELNRQTITGEFDLLYKSLIELFEGRKIDENEYTAKYLKAHLDRGANLLYSEYRYGSDFLTHLLDEKKRL